jgi:fructokinase
VGFGPQRILIGGGVACSQVHLFPRIREQLKTSLNGYLDIERVAGGLDAFIALPGLAELAGPLGALAVAADAYAYGSGKTAGSPASVAMPARMI